jgi:hypothetical protein
MNNRVEIDYRAWQGKSAEQLGYEGPLTEVKRYAVPRKSLRGSRAHDVLIASARQNEYDPIIYMSTPYDTLIDDHVERQIGTLATQRHALVALSEQPDSRNQGARRPLRQVLQAFHGNYDSLVHLQLDSIESVLGADIPDGSEIELQGMSQAALYAVGALGLIARGERPKAYNVRYLDLIDPVNARQSSLSRILKVSSMLRSTEANLLRHYLEENKLIGHGLQDTEALRHRESLTTLLGGAGLRRGIDGLLVKLLTDPATRDFAQRVKTNFFYGVDSSVSLASDIFPTVDAINAAGGDAHAIALFGPEGDKVGHHFVRSLGLQAEFAIAVAEDRAEHYGIEKLAA